jgi:hypothetical protein
MTERFVPQANMMLEIQDGRFVTKIGGELVPAEVCDDLCIPGNGLIVDENDAGETIYKKALFMAWL